MLVGFAIKPKTFSKHIAKNSPPDAWEGGSQWAQVGLGEKPSSTVRLILDLKTASLITAKHSRTNNSSKGSGSR